MSSDNPTQLRTASPPAMSWIVAAIVLVLHWVVPAPFLFHADVRNDGGTPFASTDTRALYPGTAPRVQPRSVACEAGIPKAPLQRLSTGAKPDALATGFFQLIAPHAPSHAQTVRQAARPRVVRRHFNSRAPPLPTA